MKYYLTILFITVSLIASGTDYYVKNGGSDSGAGTSDGTAWETITKVNTEWSNGTFAAGDNIYFNRGDTFSGTIVISESGTSGNPITIGAYGTGDKPILTTLATLSSWTDNGDGRYYATTSTDAQTNMVIVDGEPVGMGRYPDSGTNLTLTSPTANQITCTGIGDSPDWEGAELVISKTDYNLDRTLCTDHTGDVFTFTNLGTSVTPLAGRYFFIQNDLRCVTSENEWYHDYSANRLYIYGNPSTKTVQIATKNYIIDNSGGYDFITIDNLDLIGSISNIIHYGGTGSARSWTVTDCNISYAGLRGIYLNLGADFIATGNTITHCHDDGIYVRMSGSIIKNNTISYIGMIAGALYYSSGWGIHARVGAGYTSVIDSNTVSYTNHVGINSAGDGTQYVRYNFVNYPVHVIDDGGGIYIDGHSSGVTRIIDHNIVLNSGTGAPADVAMARGIYLDGNAGEASVTYNVIAHCRSAGIFNGGGINNTYTNNLVYDASYSFFVQDYSSWGGNVPTGLTLENNIFFAKETTQMSALIYLTSVQLDALFTSADYNYYARPINQGVDDDLFLRSGGGVEYYTLAEWQTATGQEVNSNNCLAGTVSSSDDIHFIYNETTDTKYYSLSSTMKDVTNTEYSGVISLSPFSGKVLLGVGTVTDATEYQPTSGILIDADGNFMIDADGNIMTTE